KRSLGLRVRWTRRGPDLMHGRCSAKAFSLVVSDKHRLANQACIDLDELSQERLLMRTYCEQAEQIAALLRSRNITAAHSHELSSDAISCLCLMPISGSLWCPVASRSWTACHACLSTNGRSTAPSTSTPSQAGRGAVP